MKFQICESIEELEAEAVVIGIPEGAERCDQRFAAAAAPLFESGDLPLKPLETLILPGKQKIVFIGISRTGDSEAWRRAASTAVRRLKKAKSIAFAGGDLRAMAEGALVGSFSVETYKTNNHSPAVERVVFVGGEPRALEQGAVIGESINWARALINEPSNRKPPREIAERAREMAGSVGLTVDICYQLPL